MLPETMLQNCCYIRFIPFCQKGYILSHLQYPSNGIWVLRSDVSSVVRYQIGDL